MQPRKYGRDEIYGIDTYFKLDHRMRIRDWLRLTMYAWFDNARYHNFYYHISNDCSVKEAFKRSKNKEYEYTR